MIKTPRLIHILILTGLPLLFSLCNRTKTGSTASDKDSLPGDITPANIRFNGDTSKTGMVYIPGGQFMMGADNEQAARDEYPKHSVSLDGFWMDEHEVTNAQFAKFVEATGYVTTAEKKPDWI